MNNGNTITATHDYEGTAIPYNGTRNDIGIYEMFKAHHPEIENTFLVKTSKGIHAYFRVEGHIVNKQKIGKVDIQGQGSLVVAPPSIHPTGIKYTVMRDNPIMVISVDKWESY